MLRLCGFTERKNLLMPETNGVAARIEKIKSLFQSTLEFCANESNVDSIVAGLEKEEAEYRSIAYEAAAMSFALKDFAIDNELKAWQEFANGPAKEHSVHAHVGLGWAVAQQNVLLSPILPKLNPLLRYRVADGCGYYEGIFRQRRSVRMHQLPEYIEGKALKACNQGIGRALWYFSQGDANRTRALVESFDSGRRADLWRGVGIAVTFVGGCDEEVLKNLFSYASTYQVQLAAGAALAARVRIAANSLTKDAELACKIWGGVSAEDATNITRKLESKISENPGENYFDWIEKIETKILSKGISV